MNFWARIFVLFMLLLSVPLLAAEKIPFQPSDIFKLKSASSPLISPDGKQIIYVIRGIDLTNDVPNAETWIMNSDGSDQRRLLSDGGGAVWSPDSNRIAYVAPDEKGKAQIFLLDMKSPGAGVAISNLDHAPSGLSWSPDGQSIAFFSFVPQDPTWQVELPVPDARPEGAVWSGEPLITDRLNFRVDGAGWLPDGHDHVYVISADGGKARQVTSGDWPASILMYGGNRAILAWHPDSERLYFPANMVPDSDMFYEGYINEVNLESGKLRRITRETGNWGSPKISPDGKYLAYVGFDSAASPVYQMQELWVSKIDGSDRRRVSGKLDDTVYDYFWSTDSKSLYFNLAKNGERQIYRARLKGEPEKLTEGEHMLFPSSLSKNGLLAGTRTSGLEPAEAFVMNTRKPAKRRQLTKLNPWLYEERTRGDFKRIDFVSADGTSVQQWLALPPDFDADNQYPLIVWLHGGPYSAYGQYYQETVDYLAANGHVVALINYRSTTGYGTAFANGSTGGFPAREDFEDVMAGVDAALAQGYVDPERLFVAGCSAGGIETAWIVGKTDRFKAAVAMCPNVNMISAATTSDFPIWGFRHREKPFWEDPQAWLDHSSIMEVGRVKTPTAVFVGENDTGTPVSQSVEYYIALKWAGVPTRLVLFRDEGHWFYKPVNKIRMIEYMLDWFRQYDPALQ